MSIKNVKKIYLIILLVVGGWGAVFAAEFAAESDSGESCVLSHCHCESSGEFSSDEDDGIARAFSGFDIKTAVIRRYPSLSAADAAIVFYNPVSVGERVTFLRNRFNLLKARIGNTFCPLHILMFLVARGSITPAEANAIKMCEPWRETCAGYTFRSRGDDTW